MRAARFPVSIDRWTQLPSEDMAPSAAAPLDHAWERGHRLLELTFAAVLTAACAIVALADAAGPLARTVAVALLLCQVPAYLLLGRAAMSDDPPRPRRFHYVLLVAGLFVPATVLAPTAAYALFALAPLTYMTVHPVIASIMVAILNTGPITSILTGEGASRRDSIVGVALIAGALVLSFVFGMWIHHVVKQSRERADLVRRLDETRAELAEVSRHAGVLEERRRMAREIHDTLAQGFSSIVMLLQAAEADTGGDGRYLRLAHRAARDNLDDARALVSGSLDIVDLPESLRDTAKRIGEELSADVGFTVTGAQRRLGPQIEIAVLRVVQEALANVRKHSGADRVEVELEYAADALRIRVRDNGSGFDPDAAHHGHGLTGLRERVERLGGKADITCSDGTTVTVEIPT